MIAITAIRLADPWSQPTVAASTHPEPRHAARDTHPRQAATPAYKRAVLDAVQAALVAAGVPANDRFQRVLELAPEDFVFDERYPDLARPRDRGFVLVEYLLRWAAA